MLGFLIPKLLQILQLKHSLHLVRLQTLCDLKKARKGPLELAAAGGGGNYFVCSNFTKVA